MRILLFFPPLNTATTFYQKSSHLLYVTDLLKLNKKQVYSAGNQSVCAKGLRAHSSLHESRYAIALALGKLPPFHHPGLSVESMLCAGRTGTSPPPNQGIRRQLSGERQCFSLKIPAPPRLESTDTGQLTTQFSIVLRRSKLKPQISFAIPRSQDLRETSQPVLQRLWSALQSKRLPGLRCGSGQNGWARLLSADLFPFKDPWRRGAQVLFCIQSSKNEMQEPLKSFPVPKAIY